MLSKPDMNKKRRKGFSKKLRRAEQPFLVTIEHRAGHEYHPGLYQKTSAKEWDRMIREDQLG